MVATDRVRALFADARDLQADALEMLEQGLLRNAAEKAWGATKRATDALAWPGDRRGTGAVLRELHWPQDAGIPRPRGTKGTRLVRRYYTRQGHLQGGCFYAGLCEPIEETERRIRETSDYIDAAERLADRHDQ